jgi:starch-binding outer membrane protein, SusD/RagB family
VDYFSFSYAGVGDYKVMDQNLFNQMPANDTRRTQFFNNPASALNLLPINKFYNPRRIAFGGGTPIQDDIHFYRISEVHLLAAECAAKSGNEARAKAILKNFMSLRVPDASYVDGLNGAQLTNHIYLQTRIELWGEGKSYLAMKRNKATISRGANHLSFVGVAIPYNDERLTFEIPVQELKDNPFISTQN